MGERRRDTRRRTLAGVAAVAGLLATAALEAPAAATPATAGGLSGGLVAEDVPAPVTGRAAQIRQRSFTLHGIPLRRAHATVLAEGTGDRVVAEVLPLAAPELLPTQARITAEDALTRAREHVTTGLGAPPPAMEPGPLVYLTILGVPVLAYEVDMPLSLAALEPSKKTVWISASSGIVLDEWEHVQSSKARVFLTNPAKTPVPIEVTLSGVHAEGPGVPLVGDRVQSFNCSLEEPDEVVDWWSEGKCYPLHRALSDENGDFNVPLPDIILPADNADGDDLYAELSMYWNAERFLDRMKELGVPKFKCDLSTMLANYRTTELSPSYPDLAFTPLNNAYWTNTCKPESGATMIFGQGGAVDFGYDGDVVYHELGHGMVSLLTPTGLGARKPRSDAMLADAGGINEAVADYFSVMLTNDPVLADYVARFWPGYGASIRNAENTKTCPDDTIGQVHNDGEPFMAALWATRKRVGAERLDPMVIDMLTRLPIDSDLETASWTLLDLAEQAHIAGEWTQEDLDQMIRAFDTRGLYECERVIKDPERVAGGRTMYLRPKTAAVTPFFPGPMQLRHAVPEGSDNVVVRFRLAPREDGPADNPVGVLVLLKREDAPLAFDYTLTALDKSSDGGSKGSVREVIKVEGDWDLALPASLLGESDNQLVLRGFRPGEVVHVALANIGPSESVASGVAVVSLPTEFLDEGSVHVDAELGDSDSDSGSSGAGLDAPEVEADPAMASCACKGGDAPGAGLVVLAMAGLAARRRRRT